MQVCCCNFRKNVHIFSHYLLQMPSTSCQLLEIWNHLLLHPRGVLDCIVVWTSWFLCNAEVNPMPNPWSGVLGCIFMWNLTLNLSYCWHSQQPFTTHIYSSELHRSLRGFVYIGDTVQCFTWLNSKSCVWTSDTIAAVRKVHCLFGVSCCLAVDWVRLQGSFLWVDMRTLKIFHVLLGKIALECYTSLKEGLGTHVPSYETLSQWVNAIKNGQEDTDDHS